MRRKGGATKQTHTDSFHYTSNHGHKMPKQTKTDIKKEVNTAAPKNMGTTAEARSTSVLANCENMSVKLHHKQQQPSQINKIQSHINN